MINMTDKTISKIANKWKSILNYYNRRIEQLKKKHEISKIEFLDEDIIQIDFKDDRYISWEINGKIVWEIDPLYEELNWKVYQTIINDFDKLFETAHDKIRSYVEDKLGLIFEWEEYTCNYYGDEFIIYGDSFETDVEKYEIEYR